jgi:NAD(P)-dependent dehydrogenase (short-subunit alcohol dehydrogenase family)
MCFLSKDQVNRMMTQKSIWDLSGNVALVTGGGSGIGRALCEAMAEFGADVACCDINNEGAQETAQLIRKFGHRTLVIKADLSRPEDVEDTINRAVTDLGSIDILFNNAGVVPPEGKIHETGIEVWDRVMAIDLRGVFLCMRAALPVMIRQKRGSVINISSINGLQTNRASGALLPMASYNAAKAGVIALTRQAALEYAGYGIRVNSIAPGTIGGTNIGRERREALSPEMEKKLLETRLGHTLLGRTGKPDDLKGVAVYLASEASSFVTGQTFVIDGGQLA